LKFGRGDLGIEHKLKVCAEFEPSAASFRRKARIRGRKLKRSGEFEPIGMEFGVGSDFFANRLGCCACRPVPKLKGFSRVEDDPRQIKRSRAGIGCDSVRAETSVTPCGELA